MVDFVETYIILWAFGFTIFMLISVIAFVEGYKRDARLLAICGIIGPIPSIIFYFYKLFK